jgi:allophanate hydrolase subunit 1
MNKIHFVKKSNAKYVLMANRVVNDDGNNPNALKIDTCFNKYIGTDVVSVIRTGRKLSVIRLLKTSAK